MLPSILEDGLKEETQPCHICLLPGKEPINSKLCQCSGLFHQDCWDKWLLLNNCCPTCRKVLYQDELPPGADNYLDLVRSIPDLTGPSLNSTSENEIRLSSYLRIRYGLYFILTVSLCYSLGILTRCYLTTKLHQDFPSKPLDNSNCLRLPPTYSREFWGMLYTIPLIGGFMVSGCFLLLVSIHEMISATGQIRMVLEIKIRSMMR